MTKRLACVLVLAVSTAFAAPATPAPTKISNEDAASLFGALNSIKDGLSPANVSAASEDLWILKAASEAFGSQQNKLAIAQSRANADQQAANGPPINPAKSQAAIDEAAKAIADWDAYRQDDAKIPVPLVPLTPLTDQEMKDTKITPAILSPIQHFLYPPK